MNNIQNLIDLMQSHGLQPDNTIYHAKHGKKYRCPTDAKPDKKIGNGEYTIFYNSDGSMGASFIDYQVGIRQKWYSANKDKLSVAEKANRAKIAQEHKQQIESDQKEALSKLRTSFNQYKISDANSSHEYLIKKRINHWFKFAQADRLKFDSYNNLIMPMRNIDNELMGFQRITATGDKWFTSGSSIKGCFYLMTTNEYEFNIKSCDYLFAGESLGNMITTYLLFNNDLAPAKYRESNYGCVVSGGIYNLENALLSIWSKYNHFKEIILIADNDCGSKENTGVNTCNDIFKKYSKQHNIRIFTPRKGAVK